MIYPATKKHFQQSKGFSHSSKALLNNLKQSKGNQFLGNSEKKTQQINSKASTCQSIKTPMLSRISKFEIDEFILTRERLTQSDNISDLKMKINPRKKTISNFENIISNPMTTSLFFNEIQKSFQISNFHIIKQIGTGSFCRVYLALETSSRFICALKIIPKQKIKDPYHQNQLLQQIKIQFFLNHTNIIKLYGIFQQRNHICLIQQYGGQTSLFKIYKEIKNKPLNEKQIRNILKHVCRGISQLHQKNIIHRDLKIQNVIIQYEIPKICDLGCAIQSVKMRQTQIGSLPYFSPQQLKQQKYGKKKDIWSFGIMAYQLLCGKSAYNAQIAQLLSFKPQQRQLKQFKLPKNLQISLQAQDFLQNLLKINQWQRISASKALQHPFFKST